MVAAVTSRGLALFVSKTVYSAGTSRVVDLANDEDAFLAQ